MASSRDLALKVLVRVEQGQAYAASTLAKELESARSPQEASLATELVFGVLRTRSHLDRLIESASRKGLANIDPITRQILRLGAYQIVFLQRIPHRAAVSEAVNQVRKRGAPGLSGLVNALLRGLARRESKDLLPNEPSEGTALEEAALNMGLPPWILERFALDRGMHKALATARAFNTAPQRTIRINVHRLPRSRALAELGDIARAGALTPWSIHVFDPQAARDLVDRGLAIYEDEGAQLAVLAVAPCIDDVILDACAGRGGKTSTLAMASGGAEIVAVDKNESKLERLSFELKRQSLSAQTVAADLTQSTLPLPSSFSKILVDAPCSGSGTLGRRPEIRWRLLPNAVRSLALVQQKILASCSRLLAPEGRLVYVVCSLFAEEGSEQIQLFLNKYPEFEPVHTPPETWPHGVPWNNGAIFVDPAETGTDGYQIFCLMKRHC